MLHLVSFNEPDPEKASTTSKWDVGEIDLPKSKIMLALARELTVKRRAALCPSTVPEFQNIFQMKVQTYIPVEI